MITQNYSMNISDSRAISDDKSQFKTTKGSFFSKSLSREVRPSWGNRMVKDFYDLDYEHNDSFSMQNSHKFYGEGVNQAGLRKLLKNKSRRQSSELSRKQKIKSLSREKMMKNMSIHHPETIQIGKIQKFQTKYGGLCPYEYSHTIAGHIENKSSHHINISKQKTNRIVNEHEIYYQRHEDIDFSYLKQRQHRKRLKKYHPFDSYLPRKVFEPRDELDKIFDTNHSLEKATARRSRQAIRRFDLVIERREQPNPQSSTLTYDVMPCLELVKKKSISSSVPQSSRQIEFTRQVISSRRGCYR